MHSSPCSIYTGSCCSYQGCLRVKAGLIPGFTPGSNSKAGSYKNIHDELSFHVFIVQNLEWTKPDRRAFGSKNIKVVSFNYSAAVQAHFISVL